MLSFPAAKAKMKIWSVTSVLVRERRMLTSSSGEVQLSVGMGAW